MEESKTICSKTGDVLVVDKMLAFESKIVVFIPVAAYGQNVICALNDGYNVWQHDAGLFTIFVRVFVTFKVQVHVALIDGVAVIVQVIEASLFVLGFLNVSAVFGCVRQLNVQIKPSLL